MKIGSVCVLVALIGGSAAVGACSSGGGHGPPTSDAGSGGAATGGAPSGGTGGGGSGGQATGGGTSSGGSLIDASPEGGETGGAADSGSGGAATGGASGAGGVIDAGPPPPRGAAYPKVPYTVENPQDPNKEMLGKILFWEEQIGQIDDMACGTCHRAGAGGSDPRTNPNATGYLPLSHAPGFDGKLDNEATMSPLSDDLHVGVGMPVCTQTAPPTALSPDGTITGLVATPRQTTTRKPPTYLDAMFAQQIFWDGRAGYCKKVTADAGTAIDTAQGGCFYDPDLPTNAPPLIINQVDPSSGRVAGGALEAQAIGPPVNSHEMACANRSWADIAAKLKIVAPLAKARSVPDDMKTFIADHGSNYPQMFDFVYGSQAGSKVQPGVDPDNVINTRRVVFAITSHERRLVSDQTPWDRWNAGDDSAMTPRQVQGFGLFMGKANCSRCHAPPLFTDLTFHFIGFHLPKWDLGREAIVVPDDPTLAGKMKTPTLRNVGLREAGGLLHSGDGPGHDLTSVLGLYNSGGRADVALQTDPSIVALSLTADEITALTDFLRNGLTDPRVQQEAAPFDRPQLSTE